MKKTTLFTLLAAATAIVASCSKTEVIYDQGSEIGFTPATSHLTKAALNSTVLPTTCVITTYGYYKSTVAAGTGVTLQSFKNATEAVTTYIDAAPFKNMGGNLWHGDPTAYYWPKTGSIVFAGYTEAPAGVNLAFSYDDNALTSTDYVQTHNTAATKDFLYFNLTDPASKSTVPVAFNHALSWISFEIKAADETVANKVTVNSITLKTIKDKASLNTSSTTGIWSAQAFNDTTDQDIEVSTTDITPTTTSTLVANNGVIVIPQDATSIEVTYTTTLSATEIKTETVTVNLSGNGNWKEADGTTDSGEALNKWAEGRHYTYKLTLGLKEIIFAPTVNAWVERTFDGFTI